MGRNPRIKRAKRTVSYVLIRLLIGFFRVMPRRVALGIGAIAGRLAPLIASSDRRRARDHLVIAFGGTKTPMEVDRLVRDMFKYLALNFIDTVRVRTMSPESLRAISIPHHMNRLRDALAGGNGAIGLTSHAGCWELLGAYLVAEGIPLSVISKRLYDPRLEELLLDSRKSAGIENISRGSDTREIVRTLKHGRLLGVLIDQDTDVKGVFVDFFGVPAHTAVAPAVLSLKYGAPIVPVLTWRDQGDRHHIFIGEPVKAARTGNLETDAAALTAACSTAIEEFIREHPEQWVWFHRRWKTKPPEQSPSPEHTGTEIMK